MGIVMLSFIGLFNTYLADILESWCPFGVENILSIFIYTYTSIHEMKHIIQ